MFALKGLREFHLFPFKYRGGVECVLACAHASVFGTIERKGRGKEEIRGETGFSESAPGTCYVTWNRAIVSPIPRARIHGQTSLDERKGVSIGKDPSLLFTTQRGSPSLVEFSFLDKSIYIFWLEKLNWIILIIKIIFVYEKKSNSTMRAFCEKKVRDKVRLFILIITWTLWKKYRFKRS